MPKDENIEKINDKNIEKVSGGISLSKKYKQEKQIVSVVSDSEGMFVIMDNNKMHPIGVASSKEAGMEVAKEYLRYVNNRLKK